MRLSALTALCRVAALPALGLLAAACAGSTRPDPGAAVRRNAAWQVAWAARLAALSGDEKTLAGWTRFEADTPGHDFTVRDGAPWRAHRIRDCETWAVPTPDGATLRGWLITVPRPRATLIVVHGWTSDAAFALYQTEFLRKAGYQLFVYDRRVWSWSTNPEAYVGHPARDVADIGLLADRLAARPGGGPLGIVGFSYGGYLSLVAAARYPALRAVVVDGQPFTTAFTMAGQAPDTGLLGLFRARHGVAYTDSAWDTRHAVAAIAPRPLLLLHGEADRVVPVDLSRQLFAAARDPKQLATFPGVTHCLGMWQARAAYTRTVTNFLARYLQPQTK